MRIRPPLLLVLLLVLVARPGQTASTRTARISVAVAARDLAAGERVTEADIAQVLVSEEWMTTSLVRSDSRQDMVGQRLLLPMLKGDPFVWNLFKTSTDSTLRDGCTQAARTSGTASEQVARARQLVIEGKRSTTPRRGK
jgi:pilus assembly protein CpaB